MRSLEKMSITVIVDTETTGLGAQRGREDGIVEIGLAYRDKTGVVQRWSSICDPGHQFFEGGRADEALRINNISREAIAGAKSAREVAGELHRRLGIIKREQGPFEITAFNVQFDQPFLAADPWHIPRWAWIRCVMLAATERLDGPNGRWLRLGDALKRFNIPWPEGDAHRAEVDAHAALLVHEHLLKNPKVLV
jgi:DNA polymerase III epsilon subunit-like protein